MFCSEARFESEPWARVGKSANLGEDRELQSKHLSRVPRPGENPFFPTHGRLLPAHILEVTVSMTHHTLTTLAPSFFADRSIKPLSFTRSKARAPLCSLLSDLLTLTGVRQGGIPIHLHIHLHRSRLGRRRKYLRSVSPIGGGTLD